MRGFCRKFSRILQCLAGFCFTVCIKIQRFRHSSWMLIKVLEFSPGKCSALLLRFRGTLQGKCHFKQVCHCNQEALEICGHLNIWVFLSRNRPSAQSWHINLLILTYEVSEVRIQHNEIGMAKKTLNLTLENHYLYHIMGSLSNTLLIIS